jgi:hypothetical protein
VRARKLEAQQAGLARLVQPAEEWAAQVSERRAGVVREGAQQEFLFVAARGVEAVENLVASPVGRTRMGPCQPNYFLMRERAVEGVQERHEWLPDQSNWILFAVEEAVAEGFVARVLDQSNLILFLARGVELVVSRLTATEVARWERAKAPPFDCRNGCKTRPCPDFVCRSLRKTFEPLSTTSSVKKRDTTKRF